MVARCARRHFPLLPLPPLPPPGLCLPCSLPLSERATLDAPLRGVLAETALTGLQRYEWRLLAPLLHSLVDAVLADFGRQEAEVSAHANWRPDSTREQNKSCAC